MTCASPSDQIHIRNIRFRAPCGVLAEERTLGVAFSADLTLFFDLSPAAHSDDLSQTADYGAVARTVVAAAAGERLLVERLAEDIAKAVLAQHPVVRELTVALTKPHPPLDEISGGITISLHRCAND